MNHKASHHPSSIGQDESERFQELIYKLYQCCQNRIQNQSIEFDLPDAELRCLRLFGLERYLTPKGIARRMDVVKSRITKILDGLLGKNLIQRSKDPEDSRMWLLSLTPQGRRKLTAINRSLVASNEEILSSMTPDQRKSLLINLERLRASMQTKKKA